MPHYNKYLILNSVIVEKAKYELSQAIIEMSGVQAYVLVHIDANVNCLNNSSKVCILGRVSTVQISNTVPIQSQFRR